VYDTILIRDNVQFDSGSANFWAAKVDLLKV